MTEPKALGLAHLSHVDLGNHNAGEGGSQLSDLKKVGNRPYISGQAYRHAIKDALRDLTAEGVDCIPAHACGHIESCKMCDLFGYMNTEELGDDDQPPAKRVSPLRVSPLVGQYDQPVTTDMILQYDVETEEGDLSHKIGYREMTENVFRGSLALDVPAVGEREQEYVADDEGHGRYKRTLKQEIGDEERKARIKELLQAVENASQLAGQARHMADFMPDFMVAAALPVYNQRITNAIRINHDEGEVNTDTLESVLKDLVNLGGEVWVAGTYNPSVMNNWDEVMAVAEETEGVTTVDSVTTGFSALEEHIDETL